MHDEILIGTLLAVLGGVMQGSFVFPMRSISGWRWENTWLIYSIAALLVVPICVASVTVPGLASLYTSAPAGAIATAALFGFAWGLANVLFGLAVSAVGMSVTFSIVCGLSASLGALVPLLVSAPERILQRSGLHILTGVALALIGVSLIGAAGRRRETKAGAALSSGATGKGILLAVAAGVLAPALNFSLAFGKQIINTAVQQGAAATSSGDAIWVVCLAGGFVSNGGYAVLKLNRAQSWTGFGAKSPLSNWLLGALMGLLFTGGILLYSRGAGLLGRLGPVIGWPVFQATMVLTSTLLGTLSGEWRGAHRQLVLMVIGGLSTLIVAILVLSLANRA